MSFIFRAYHAMARQRGMSTRKGLPTAAIYVFVNMLRKLRDDFSPQYLAAVFDVAAPTFRDQQYKEYKANRSEMPGDLAQQIPYIRQALEAYRIPILEMPGFEADDVIGTLATKAVPEATHVYVVSSDKDMLQLVNDQRAGAEPAERQSDLRCCQGRGNSRCAAGTRDGRNGACAGIPLTTFQARRESATKVRLI